MKKIAIIMMLLLTMGSVSAQKTSTNNLTKSELKEKKKAEKEAMLQKQFETNYQMLCDTSFALKAEFLTFKADRNSVNGNINFVWVDTAGCVVQLASGNSVGYNGLGGITIKGKIVKYKFSKNDKQRSCFLNMLVDSRGSAYSVIIDIPAEGYASASVSLNYGPVIYEGPFLPVKEANACKGTTPF
jgi:hypothetical protein